MIRIHRHHLEARARERPPGYLDRVSAAGVWDGDVLVLTPEAYAELVALYNPAAATAAEDWPTIPELVGNFAGAMVRWVKDGCRVVTEEQFSRRLVTCRACPEWSETAGIERCRACGCAKLKLWLASERCPKGLWT